MAGFTSNWNTFHRVRAVTNASAPWFVWQNSTSKPSTYDCMTLVTFVDAFGVKRLTVAQLPCSLAASGRSSGTRRWLGRTASLLCGHSRSQLSASQRITRKSQLLLPWLIAVHGQSGIHKIGCIIMGLGHWNSVTSTLSAWCKRRGQVPSILLSKY